MNEKSNFSPDDGFRTIYAMIQSAKSTIGENYMYYLLWGYLVLSACLSEFALIRWVHFEKHYMVWPVLMGIGAVVSVILVVRHKRMGANKSFIGRAMGFLWGGWATCFLILMLFANLRGEYETILPLTLAMYGMGVFISGGIVEFRPFIIGGIVAWMGAVVAHFQPYTLQLLIVSGVIIVSYVIPGHLLRRLSISLKA